MLSSWLPVTFMREVAATNSLELGQKHGRAWLLRAGVTVLPGAATPMTQSKVFVRRGLRFMIPLSYGTRLLLIIANC